MMNLTCAILHADRQVSEQLEAFIAKTPFLALCGKYNNPIEALKGYYDNKVHLYFVGIGQEETEGINGMEFCKLLSPYTRVIFIADTPRYAAECFRLDALDYLISEVSFPVFFEAVNKASRWFSLKGETGISLTALPEKSQTETCQPETPKVIYVKSDNRIFRLDISRISYIEGLGDYVKIYSKDEPKPVLSLCTMKYMEEKLPSDEFIRVHRSFIIRKDCIRIIESSKIALDKRSIPIGEVYRKKLKNYIADYSVL